MYGQSTYGSERYGEYDVTVFDFPALAPPAPSTIGMSASLQAGIHIAGGAFVPTSLRAGELPAPKPSNTTQIRADLMGFIKPYLYDIELYDDRIIEANGQGYTINMADFGVSAVACYAPPLVPDMLTGGSPFYADCASCLEATDVPGFPVQEFFMTTPVALALSTTEHAMAKDDLTQYNAVADKAFIFGATESAYNPPQYNSSAAALPGLTGGLFIDSQRWAMTFPGTIFELMEGVPDFITVPSGDPTGLNGVLYTQSNKSLSPLYGHENVYANRGMVYLGIVNWSTFFMDKNKMAHEMQHFSYGSLACGVAQVQPFADYLFALHDIPATYMRAVPGPAASGEDPRQSLLYARALYADKSAVYCNLLQPSNAGGHAVVGVDFVELSLDTQFTLSEGFLFSWADAQGEVLVPLLLHEAAAYTVFESGMFDGSYDNVFFATTDQLADIQAAEQEHIVPLYCSCAGSIPPLLMAVFDDYDKIIEPADILHIEALAEMSAAVISSDLAESATLHFGMCTASTLSLYAMALNFPAGAYDAVLAVPYYVDTAATAMAMFATFNADVADTALQAIVPLIIDISVDRMPEWFAAVDVIDVLLPVLACGTPGMAMAGTVLRNEYACVVPLSAAAADAMATVHAMGLMVPLFTCDSSSAAVRADALVGLEYVVGEADTRAESYTHAVSLLQGDFACLPYMPVPAGVMRGLGTVDDGIVFVPDQGNHDVSFLFDDGAACTFSNVFSDGYTMAGFYYNSELASSAVTVDMSHTIEIAVPNLTCVPNGCPYWGYIIVGCTAINIIPKSLWYEMEIEYDYSNTDPKDLAFIF